MIPKSCPVEGLPAAVAPNMTSGSKQANVASIETGDD
jgi:hypothetical protein